MCCFSREASVSDTNIYARSSKEGRQFVVYGMSLFAREDMAMILPIPVPKDTAEDAVKFINLEKYPTFFQDLRAGFPQRNMPFAGGFGGIPNGGADAMPLKVVEVGAFEASFVPAVKDFKRLDERFRLPTEVWDKLPRYKDFGFTVFKLKKTEEPKAPGKKSDAPAGGFGGVPAGFGLGFQRIHPMAFEFPRADKNKVFFPTVHIHDGKVHPRAEFDHALFSQPDRMLMNWKESQRPAGMFMKIDKSQGLFDPRRHVYMREIRGTFKNEDVLV